MRSKSFSAAAARSARGARCADGMDRRRAGCGFGEQGVEIAKIFLKFAELASVDAGAAVVDGEGELGLFVFQLGLEDLARAGNGVALVVEQALDAQRHFDVAAAVETLAGAALVGLELGKLALPEAQDVGWNVAEFGDFADAEVELVRDVRPGGWGSFADWLVLRHARKLRYRGCRTVVAHGSACVSIGHWNGMVCNFSWGKQAMIAEWVSRLGRSSRWNGRSSHRLWSRVRKSRLNGEMEPESRKRRIVSVRCGGGRCGATKL